MGQPLLKQTSVSISPIVWARAEPNRQAGDRSGARA